MFLIKIENIEQFVKFGEIFIMGVVAKSNLNYYSLQTSALANWIGLLKVKKNNFKCQKRKNLFIQAVLNKALSHAEIELRHKQQERKLRWQHLRSSWSKPSCKSRNNLDPKDSDELNDSLDEFMSQLKSINVHIAR